MTSEATEGASFRDPSGRVYIVDGRVFRTVMPCAVADYEFVRATGLTQKLIESGQLIPETVVEKSLLGEVGDQACYVLEHPLLPFISYPYEWSFSALKAASMHHLDVHLCALDYGVTLTDATTYNIQFKGAKPVFIDSLSFRPYQLGEFWLGHRQFCEQFLNPLLLRSLVGIPHNAWYRGSMEGISAQDLNKVLPLRRKFSLNVLMHVIMQARFQSQTGGQVKAQRVMAKRQLSLDAFKQMLKGLRHWIQKLEPNASGGKTVWEVYATDNSYSSDEAQIKRRFITEFTQSVAPKILWDIGCNTGAYSKVALEAGAGSIVGFDFDQGALDQAFSLACSEQLNFFPIFLDVANPTPSQGWAHSERLGLSQRANANAMISLALVHHLAIGKNIPLPWIVDWLVSLAPQGVIEFVPKNDPMVQELLRLREDIFSDYSVAAFERALEEKSTIVRQEIISANGRQLFWFRRR